MTKPIKSRLLILGLLIVAVMTVIIIYMSILKYSISEISADNYKSKLKENISSLSEAQLNEVIPDKFSIYDSKDFLTSDNFENNGLRITNNARVDGRRVEISSTRTQLNYWINFTEGKLTNVFIFKQALLNPNSPPTPLIKEMINKLIIQEGFVLKKSELKNGSDIIIKETKDSFIIGDFYSYDDLELTANITISSFSRKKYF
jgi:hypothetical protein